jgi:HEAT repeat protein
MDDELRGNAFEAWAALGPLPPEGVALAKAALSGPARQAAAEALGNGCDDPEVPPILLRLAKEDENAYARIRAGLAYARLTGDAKEVIPILAKELARKADLHHLVGSMKQNAASKALARIGAPAVPALVEALATDDDFARDQAAKALFDIGDPVRASEPRLRELASSGDAKVKEQAQRILDWLAARGKG